MFEYCRTLNNLWVKIIIIKGIKCIGPNDNRNYTYKTTCALYKMKGIALNVCLRKEERKLMINVQFKKLGEKQYSKLEESRRKEIKVRT